MLTTPVMGMLTTPVMPSPRVIAGTSRAVPLRRTPTRFRAALRDCSAVVGLHSDHATEWIVDFALERGIPFAVVPCCVCPGSFPHRRLRGAPVSTHDDFVEYLVSKAPEEMGVARLGFEGKDHVVYSTWGETRGVGGGRRDRESG